MNHPPTLNVDTADIPDRPLSPGSSIYSGRTLSPGPRKRDRFLSPFQASSRSRISLDQQDDLPVEPLTEQDLRDIFEEEEIQRFLNTFHSQVGEVTLPEGQYGTDASTSQKIVIVPAEDAKDVAGAGAAPPSAAVETMPPSLAAELHDENDDDSDDTDADTDVGDDDSTHTDKSWVDVDKHDPKVYTPEDALPSQQKHVHTKRPPPVWGSEKAAALIVPLFPQGRAIEARNRRGGKHGKFSLTAARIAGQRAYLATYPFYVPFVLNLWDIARWINWPKSARLCAIYWLLWWNNVLLPGFLFYIVYQLLKHRLMPYPTLEQLEARRRAAEEAQSLGDALTSIGSHSGPWKSSEGYSGLGSLGMGISGATAAAQANADNMKVTSIMKMAVGAGKGALTGKFKKDKSVIDPEAKMSVVEGDQKLVGVEAQQAADWRRLAVLGIEELADVHERGKNLFLWRKPESSVMYTLVLAVGAFAILFTPAQILAKATYAGLGFFYWFIIPTLCAMTRRQRAMIPPPLFDIPTDAEYAMEVIARRIATGESVIADKKQTKGLSEAYGARHKMDAVMPNRSRASVNTAAASASSTGLVGSPLSPVSTKTTRFGPDSSVPPPVPPKEGSVGSPTTRDFAKESPVLGQPLTMEPAELPGEFPGAPLSARAPVEPQSYSAHHKHMPGIMILSNDAIEFTPFLRSKPQVRIELDRIRGVKKAGKRTLLIRFLAPVAEGKGEGYTTVDDPEGTGQDVIVMKEQEDKFKWVGHRDEVFARIVASKKDHWVAV